MIDGYQLYDLIKDGMPQSVAVGEATFQFQFKGQKFGSSNWLEVTAANGDTKKWGWGWSCEVCWHCLQDLEQSWDKPQRHRYKPYAVNDYDDDNY